MKFSLAQLNFQTIRARMRVELATALNISWAVLLILFLVFLVFDGLMFYQYGLGHAGDGGIPIAPVSTLRDKQEAIRAAAAKIEEQRAKFEAAAPIPADLPNPFK